VATPRRSCFGRHSMKTLDLISLQLLCLPDGSATLSSIAFLDIAVILRTKRCGHRLANEGIPSQERAANPMHPRSSRPRLPMLQRHRMAFDDWRPGRHFSQTDQAHNPLG
jgi:hypothetical protein